MKVLLFGGTGATGREVVRHLITKEIPSKILVRPTSNVPADIESSPLVEVIRGNVHECSIKEMQRLMTDCDTVISCLGHNITFKGMYGNPRNLVADTLKKVYRAVESSQNKKTKFILMNTTAYTNKALNESKGFGGTLILSLLYYLLPPHTDNMRAGNFLIKNIQTTDPNFEWISVRPDSLINNSEVTPYFIETSPIRNPIFDAGKTSRINVAHFMAELATNNDLWEQWKFKTPVVYNKE